MSCKRPVPEGVKGSNDQLIARHLRPLATSLPGCPAALPQLLALLARADTYEELAESLGLPVDEVVDSINRYNGMCAAGQDDGYHKRESLLLPITTPPYYICRCQPWFLTATGGLQTNLEMQVLNTEGNVVEGLYGVGTIVGDMYANCYSTHFPGHNLGGNRLTFGDVAAEAIVENE